MIYKWKYKTPVEFDDLWMSGDQEFLTGLWFENSKDEKKHDIDCEEKYLKVFQETTKWLDLYFSGKISNFTPHYRIDHLTEFRKEVIEIMNQIPYGKVITYLDISKEIAKKRGLKKMSSQAVGGAVGWNPICIIIPCHRVVGSNKNLTGYGGGVKNKKALLKLEGHHIEEFKEPKKRDVL